MPTPQLQSYAKKAGVSIEHAEREWEKAKEIARNKFKVSPGGKYPSAYWGYVSGIVKRALKITESFSEFCKHKDPPA